MDSYNVLELLRLQTIPTGDEVAAEYVAPLVDDEALAVMAWRDGISSPGLGIPYNVVAPPSLHWLGEPLQEWSGGDGVVFLTMDSEVVDPLPGGLRAFMEFAPETVTWRLVSLVSGQSHRPLYRDYMTFTFHRPEYQNVIAGLPSQSIYHWEAHLPINQQWWDAVLGD